MCQLQKVSSVKYNNSCFKDNLECALENIVHYIWRLTINNMEISRVVEDGTAAHPICSCGVFVQQTTKACCMVSVCFPGTQLDLALSELEKKTQKKNVYIWMYIATLTIGW